MRSAFILFVGLYFVGCAASNLPPSGPTMQQIDQADRVIVTVDGPPGGVTLK